MFAMEFQNKLDATWLFCFNPWMKSPNEKKNAVQLIEKPCKIKTLYIKEKM